MIRSSLFVHRFASPEEEQQLQPRKRYKSHEYSETSGYAKTLPNDANDDVEIKKNEMRPLIRGVLSVTIHEAKDLPVSETTSSKVGGFFKKMVGKKHKNDFWGTYVKIYIGKTKIGETREIDYGDERNPKWNEKFRGDVAHESYRLDVQV